MTMGVQMGSPSSGKGNVLVAPQTANTLFHPPLLYNPEKPYVLSPKASEKLQEKLVTNRELAKQKAEQRRADEAVRLTTQKAVIEAKGKEWDRQRQVKANEAAQRKAASDAARAIREKTRLEQQGAARAVTAAQRQQRAVVTGQTNKQRAAINRLQYVRTPSIRNLPMMYMLNGYAMYGFLKSELTKAVEYTNIMTSAQSILR